MVYNPQKIESKWQKFWKKTGLFEVDLKKAKKPFYNLMMFPYPSAEGLHIGNMYAFVGSDIYGRFQRMRGKDVFEPIGLDGFGIHSENYALKINQHPMLVAKKTEKNFYRQLGIIGNGFCWKNKLETYDKEYYKWTQWIFIQMFKKGLAFRKKAEVNWCPSCKTVLADEQVISDKCERCSNEVVKKELEQWFFKTTKYAKELLEDLKKIDWSERVKVAQHNWIGRSEGALMKFKISGYPISSRRSDIQNIEVFTTRPDTIFGATYLVLSPEYKTVLNLKSLPRTEPKVLVRGQILNLKEVEDYIKKAKKKTLEERQTAKTKTGVELKGIKAINPANGEEIPVWVSDYVLAGYGTGAIMAVPAHDQRDFEFSQKFNLPIKMVICPNYPEPKCPVLDKAFEGEGYLVGSGKFDGRTSQEAKKEITGWLAKKGLAQKKIIYRLRDWLISRQRYWGPPIPMIFCEKCGWQSVPEKDLPVVLPHIKNFRPTGTAKSPLATVKSFYETKCPKCKAKAKRETDVSDTFLDSSWYYFRYLDVHNKKKIFDREIMKKWLPVDMYIGGAEHSVLHLLYSRFLTKVFADSGLIKFREPFKKFRAHGLIIKAGAKMSKSKGNIVNPDQYIKKFGADAIRAYLMFLGPFNQGGDFRDEGISGITRFLNRAHSLKSKFQNPNNKQNPKSKIQNSKLERLLHQSIKKVTEDIENLRYNTAISQLMILLNEMEKTGNLQAASYKLFLKLLAPFAPHLAEELWRQLNPKPYALNPRYRAQNAPYTERLPARYSIHNQPWPKHDPKLVKEDIITLIIQINGKVRDKIETRAGIQEQEARTLAFSREKIKKWTEGKEIKKAIFVPGKLINIVI